MGNYSIKKNVDSMEILLFFYVPLQPIMETTITKHIIETSFSKLKQWPTAISLDDDLILMDLTAETPFPDKGRYTNFYVFGLVTQGELHYDVDTIERTVQAGQLIVVSEKRVVDNYHCSADLQGKVMAMSTSFFREVIRDMAYLSSMFLFTRSHPVQQVSGRESERLLSFHSMIRERLEDTDNNFQHHLVRTLMQAMFYDMSSVIYRFRDLAIGRHSRIEELFAQFIRLVEANCRQERRVGWYAEQMGITPKYLSEAVKEVSKNTPTEWIDNYVTLAIRLMLKDTTKTIKDISAELNFSNQSFLGKYFRLHVGMSPSEYRRK